MKRLFFSFVLLLLAGGSVGSAVEERIAPSSGYSPLPGYEAYVGEAGIGESDVRFTIGTRILYIALLKDTKGEPFNGSFIGSINGLDVGQNLLPVHPYAQVTLRRGDWDLGGGLSFSHFSTATCDDGSGDGHIRSDNLMVYGLAAWNARAPFVPFVEAGVGLGMNSFDAFSSWSENGKREFDLDDSFLVHFGAGCEYTINRHWGANLYVRYVHDDVDGQYIYRGDSRPAEPFTFTLDHLAVGAGLSYVF